MYMCGKLLHYFTRTAFTVYMRDDVWIRSKWFYFRVNFGGPDRIMYFWSYLLSPLDEWTTFQELANFSSWNIVQLMYMHDVLNK